MYGRLSYEQYHTMLTIVNFKEQLQVNKTHVNNVMFNVRSMVFNYEGKDLSEMLEVLTSVIDYLDRRIVQSQKNGFPLDEELLVKEYMKFKEILDIFKNL